MNRFLKNSFFIILILITLVTGGIKITPVSAQTGGSMQIVPLSLPAGLTAGYLNGIWGSGPNDIYAVGYAFAGSTIPLYYHKVNNDWIPVTPTLPSGWTSGVLTSVWGSGANNVYIAGYGHNGSTTVPLLYNWNGSILTPVSLTLPDGWIMANLHGIWGVNANEIYAVGSVLIGSTTLPLLYRWNGNTWVRYTPSLPNNWVNGYLYGVGGAASDNVYAVGAGSDGNANLPLLYYWDGFTWVEANPSLRLPDGWTSGTLKSIWGFADNNIYAVGSGFNGSASVPLLHYWNGSSWTPSSLPSMPAGVNVGYLTSAWGSASTDVYAVGYGFKGAIKVPLLYHKDSVNWDESSPVHPTGWSSDYLYGVWGASFNDIYAVGSGHNGSADVPLLYHSSDVPPDLLAPGDVTNFTASAGTFEGSVKLSWTAPADDHNNPGSGSVASYLVKYSTSPFTAWTDGIPVTTGLPVPGAPGTNQTMTVTGLSAGTLYYFAIRAQDEQYNLSANYATTSATTRVPTELNFSIGGVDQGSYLTQNSSLRRSFAATLNGPVKVLTTHGEPFVTSQRVVFGDSFNELMGYPADQFITEYWFPWYDMVYMNTWVVAGNPSTTQTAYVDIYIGGVKRNNTPYAIPPGDRILPQFPGVLDGPVKVVSVTGAGTSTPLPIFSSERSTYLSSFNEVMGYPADQFTTEYWFPWYDQVYMNTWISVGNPSSTQTAYVDIYISGVKRNTTPGAVPYAISPNGRVIPQFPGVLDGPVKVVSVTGSGTPTPLPIFASERSIYQGTFSEVMGYPADQFTTEYWYPWYDNQSPMSSWILVGNPSTTQTAYVDIYIGGIKRTGTFTIPPSDSIIPRFNVSSGPVQVVSVTGAGTPTAIPIFSSERSLYGPSFNEMMGYPADQLSSEYWFTWYDSVYMATELVVGIP